MAGRQSGKTTVGAVSATLRSRKPNGFGLICAPTYGELIQSTRPKFFATFPPSWIKQYNKSERWISTPWGHTIFLRSADDPDKLVGFTLDWAWLDEARNIQPEVWDRLRPALMAKKAPVDFTTTPHGHDWVWEMFSSGRKGYELFRWRAKDNPWLTEEEIEALRLDYMKQGELGMQLAKQELDAEIVELGGLSYFGAGSIARLEKSCKIPNLITDSIGIWQEPRPEASATHYVIGADVAHGDAAGDWSHAYCLDRFMGEIVARVRCRKPPKPFAKDLAKLGGMYKNAWLAVEDNDWGGAVIMHLSETGYPHLFARRTYRKGSPAPMPRVGWHTDRWSRGPMLSTLQSMLVAEWLTVPCWDFASEARDFIMYPDGVPRAIKGKNDDCVMSAAIMAAAHQAMVLPGEAQAVSAAERIREETEERVEWIDRMASGGRDPNEGPFDFLGDYGGWDD